MSEINGGQDVAILATVRKNVTLRIARLAQQRFELQLLESVIEKVV